MRFINLAYMRITSSRELGHLAPQWEADKSVATPVHAFLLSRYIVARSHGFGPVQLARPKSITTAMTTHKEMIQFSGPYLCVILLPVP